VKGRRSFLSNHADFYYLIPLEKKQMSLRARITAFCLFVLCATALAQSNEIQKGKPLPAVSATAASGRWVERAAFNPESYGKVRGISPGRAKEQKVVLYTSVLNRDFFRVAAAVDRYIARRPELAWSYVMVTDTRGAQFGGYTAMEVRARLDEIKSLARRNGIRHLSFLVAAPGSNTTDVPQAVVLAHVRTAKKTENWPIVDWVTEVSLMELQGTTLSRQISALDTIINSNQDTP
jgi:hypothetical protein